MFIASSSIPKSSNSAKVTIKSITTGTVSKVMTYVKNKQRMAMQRNHLNPENR
jgi:hypothetical protein